MYNKFFIVSLIAIQFLSCKSYSVNHYNSNPSFHLKDETIMNLLPLETFEDDLEIMQIITGIYDGKNYTFQCVLNITPDEIIAAAFTPLGNNVYQIFYSNNVIEYESIMEMSESSAIYMLADIQFCYYDKKTLEKSIRASGLEFTQSGTGNHWTRQILDDEKIIIEIERNGTLVEYRNYLRDYSYLIEELSS